TRPEGLGGSRDAGPATAGPRPPYVTEAVRGGYGTATPYSGYGRTGRTGHRGAFRAAAGPEGLFNHRLPRGGEDEGPAPADLAAFFFFFFFFLLTTAGELTADSTLFFFDLCRYGYGYGKRPRCYNTATATANALVATVPLLLLLSLSNALFGPIFSAAFFVLCDDRNRVRIRIRIRIRIRVRIRNEIDSRIRVRAKSSSHNSRYDSRYNRNNSSIRTYLRPYRTYAPYSRYLRPQSFVVLFVLTEDLPWPAAKIALLRYYGAFNQIRTVSFYDKLRRHEARRPKTKDTIDWLEKHAFLSGFSFLFLPSFPFFVFRPAYAVGSTRPEGLGGSRDAGPATAGPRPPYVTEAVRHSGYTRRLRHGYAVQRLRPYGPYGPYEGRNVG
ncbi:hypothetical protein L249_6949, partial [Ophiocordyceps polyrhachis-furcata BCC 54312]